jgi:hypothetical protein
MVQGELLERRRGKQHRWVVQEIEVRTLLCSVAEAYPAKA